MVKSLVSVIIPTFNRATIIGETVESILSQNYKNWECLVIDDGSSDYTSELMEFYCNKDNRIRYFQRPGTRQKGANACRNYGFEMSRGEYINWFDSDDIMDPEKLFLQVSSLKDSPYSFSISQTLLIDSLEVSGKGFVKNVLRSPNIFYDYLTQNLSWPTQAPIWKRSFLESKDVLFDEELQAAQEWEFYCRVLAKAPEHVVIEKPLQFLRVHNDSITYNNNKDLREWNYYLARKKIYFNKNILLDDLSRKYLQNYLLFFFKTYTRNRNIKKAFASFHLYILSENSLSFERKCLALLGMFSYWITGKGDRFLRNISFDE